jgi:intergrase/recombinase
LKFKEWTSKKYSASYSGIVYHYALKYSHLLNGNLRDLDTLSPHVYNNVIKALISLSKFLGIHQQFKEILVNYGVRLHRQDSFSSFLRIFNNSNSDLLNWYREADDIVRPNERLFLRFALFSGLRRSEAINSFNLIIELAKENRLSDYYNEELQILEHFKFKSLFLRRTKNTYVSFVPKSLIDKVAVCEPLTYAQLRKRLNKNGLRVKIDKLRDFFGSFMVRHGLIREEVDLLQGRIPPSIFIRHYWSPSFKELRDRTMNAIGLLEQSL